MVAGIVVAGVVLLIGVLRVCALRRRHDDRVSEKWLDEHVGSSGKQ
jgi:hypothetical protein